MATFLVFLFNCFAFICWLMSKKFIFNLWDYLLEYQPLQYTTYNNFIYDYQKQSSSINEIAGVNLKTIPRVHYSCYFYFISIWLFAYIVVWIIPTLSLRLLSWLLIYSVFNSTALICRLMSKSRSEFNFLNPPVWAGDILFYDSG